MLVGALGALVAISSRNLLTAPLADDETEMCGTEDPTIIGTAQDDVLEGTPHRDVIVGLAGNDVIRARAGNDLLCGKGGRDRLVGEAGDDELKGGRGRDVMAGGGGEDVARGRQGGDDMRGGPDDDKLIGGDGQDKADGGPGADKCEAEQQISCNEPPKANDDTYDVDEDGVLNEPAPGVLANDSDADNDSLTAGQASGPSDGDLNLDPDGSFTYEPDPNFSGSDSFTYRANDGNVNSAPATVTIDVTAINDQPTDITLSDNSIDENEPTGTAVGTFSVNDPDPGDTNTLSLVSGSGDTDNARFTIDSGVLKTAEVFNFENQGPFSIRVRTTDSGNLQREEEFTINVANVNEAPVVDSHTFSLAENSPNGTSVGTATFSDDDSGQSHTFSITGGNTGGAFAINSSTGAITVADSNDIDFETNPSFSLTVQVTDNGSPTQSDSETITINLTNVNEAPSDITLSNTSVDENESTGTAVGSFTVTDPDASDTTSLSLVSGAGDTDNSRFVIDNGVLETAEVFDFETQGPFSIRVRAEDAANLQREEQFTISVLNVNEKAAITAPSSVSAELDETVDIAGISISDPDAGTQPIELQLSVGDGTLTVDTTVSGGVAAGDVTGNGTDSVTITASQAKINTTLGATGGLEYLNDVGFSGTSDTLSISSDDNGNTGPGGAQTDSGSVTIQFNEPPTLDLNGAGGGENEAVTFTEDGGTVQLAPNATTTDGNDANLSQATITLTNPQDGGAEVLSVSNGGAPCVTVTTNNSHAITLSGSCPVADYQTVIRTATYNNTSNTPTVLPSRSVEFEVNDGTDDSPTRTSTVTVQTTNDPPVNTVPGSQTLDEDGSKTFSSGNGNQISISDSDAGSNAVKVTLAVTNGTLTLNGTTGLTFTPPGDGTSDQTMTFTGSQSDINAALNGLVYTPNSNYNGVDTLTITTDDQGNTGGGGAQTDTDNVGLTITAVNDGPTNTVPGSQSVDEDQPLTFSSGTGNAVSIADPDSGASDVRVTLGVSNNGRLNLATTAGLNFGCAGCSGDGVNDANMVFEGTVAEVNAALNGMTYQGVQDFNGNDTLSITTNDLGNTGSGGALSDGPDTVAITVNPVNDAPTADNETFGGAGNLNDQAHGNTTMQVDDPSDNKSAPTNPHTEISGDILDGDSDVDGPGPLIVQSAGSDAGATNGQTADGGTVSIESDGDFVYQPPASVSCDNGTDSFNYKISDQANSGGGPIPGTAIGTVTIHLEGCVWYVNNLAPGNAGTASQPFDTLQQAETASGANHTVFVFDGDNTSTGYQTGFAMNSGERLIGEHEGLVVDPDQGGSMTADSLHPANAGAHPTLTANNEDVIELDDGNEVRGFNIDPENIFGGGIAGGAGDTGGGTIDDVNIDDNGVAGQQPGIELDSTTGTFNFTNLTVNNDATGVLLNNAGTVDFGGDSGVVTLDSTGAAALRATSTNMGTSNFDDIIVSSSITGGVILNGASGTTNLGDGSGTDLSLTTASGPTPALSVANSGTVTVGSGGTDELHATGGPALDVTGTSGASFDFEDVDSTNSANDGINIDGLGTGTFVASLGDIGGAAGISFDVNGGSATITYLGNLNNGGGTTAVDITGRSGGTVTLGGPISDTNDAGGGINLSSNTGGATTLNNGTKQLNTGASDAVTFTNSDGHTLNLFAGGLDIDTTTGNGVTATTSGTLAITGSGNTIDTGTGRGLNVSDTDIAVSDVTFQRISSNGAINGIRLNNTGNVNGQLVVTGNSSGVCGGDVNTATSPATQTTPVTGDCTGGAISNSSGAGIDLTGVPGGVSLTRMRVNGGTDDGIRANNVGTTGGPGIDLIRSLVQSNGTGVGHRGVEFTDVRGISSINTSTISGSAEDNARWENNNGILLLTVTNSTFADNSATSGGDGLLLRAVSGNPTMTALINGNLFLHNRDDGFQVAVGTPIPAGSITADLNVTFTNNDVVQGVNNAPNNAALSMSPGDATQTRLKVDNNDFSGSLGSAVILNPGPNSTSAATTDVIFTNNRIGTSAVDSGSTSGIGLWGRAAGNGTNKFEIRNNTIQHFQQQGMYLRGNEGQGQVTDYTVTGNSVINPDGTGFRILLEAGSVGPDSVTPDSTDVCVDFGQHPGDPVGNRNTVASGGSPADIGVARDFAANTLTLRDYAGGDLAAYFNGRNTGTPAALTAILSNLAPAGSPAACALPAAPPLP